MFNSRKIAAFFLFFTVLGSTAIFAQNPQLPQPQQQQQPAVEVNDDELAKFANAFQVIRTINMEAQQEMAGVVEKEGMDIQRFNEIYEASLNPEAEVTATKEEQKQQENIITALESMQVTYQEKMEEAIAEQGLSAERYEEIAIGLQYDPSLQERLVKILEG